MREQSRFMSLVESCGNTAIGFAINLSANMCVLPLFGYDVGLREALGIGLIFTAISVARSYVVRRLFEAIRLRS